jgi:hypothetical protein
MLRETTVNAYGLRPGDSVLWENRWRAVKDCGDVDAAATWVEFADGGRVTVDSMRILNIREG